MKSEKIESDPYGDIGRMAEMPIPFLVKSNKLSEIPCRVSSDVHEWHNDLMTVSTMYSAKLQDE